MARVLRAPPSLAERRRAWRELIEAAKAMAARIADTCGRERVERSELPHLLAATKGLRFPIEDASAGELAEGFRMTVRALLIAGGERRRELIAPAVIAAAEALDWVITEQRHADAARSRLVTGERPESD